MFENEKTLKSYENKITEYVNGTPSVVDGNMKTWLDGFSTALPANAVVFEIGSGTGRDADYLSSVHSVDVVCSDVPAGFVSLLRDKGYEAYSFDALNDEFPISHVNGILANAVLHHFTEDELVAFLKKVFNFTKGNALFGFSVKSGEGSEWTNEKLGEPRFFQYWTRVNMLTVLIKSGFTDVEITESNGWLFVVAK